MEPGLSKIAFDPVIYASALLEMAYLLVNKLGIIRMKYLNVYLDGIVEL